MDRENIEGEVGVIVGQCEGKKDDWYNNWFLPTLGRIDLAVLAWETVLAAINNSSLFEFYANCLRANTR